MQWDEAVNQVATQVLQIVLDDGSWGTGFLVYGQEDSPLRTIATAYHVIEDVISPDKSVAPKPITATTRDGTRFELGGRNRMLVGIRVDSLDAITLVFECDGMPLPTVPLLTDDELLSVGTEIGWLGYPGIAPNLCFFSGRVSALVDSNSYFLVDGTAIHGVSGGPAFCITEVGPKIVGSITAYLPNYNDGAILPGLSMVTHIVAHRSVEVAPTEQHKQFTIRY